MSEQTKTTAATDNGLRHMIHIIESYTIPNSLSFRYTEMSIGAKMASKIVRDEARNERNKKCVSLEKR
jgi:hypothetical protein